MIKEVPIFCGNKCINQMLWNLVQRKGNISVEEMYRVFNMGIGMVAIVEKADATEIQERIPQRTFIIGQLTKGERKTVLV
jgi:phosphoribosylformylglycinamidine cyclo-ligase